MAVCGLLGSSKLFVCSASCGEIGRDLGRFLAARVVLGQSVVKVRLKVLKSIRFDLSILRKGNLPDSSGDVADGCSDSKGSVEKYSHVCLFVACLFMIIAAFCFTSEIL